MTPPLESHGHRYRVAATPFASGGMGELYEAEDLDMRRTVAVKALRAELRDDPVALARFEREARILARLDHPGICPIHERYLLDDDVPCYVMKYVRGETLAERLRRVHGERDRRRKLRGINELVSALVGVCNTVAYAHDQGVVHRDIKPENILLGDFGEVFVMDWGLAGAPGSEGRGGRIGVTAVGEGDPLLTIAGEALGTPAYMAPEQVQGDTDRIDERTDLYGIGATLHACLVGSPPRAEESSESWAREGGAGTAAEARVPPGVARDLWACRTKAMAPDPEDRYADVLALRSDLEACLQLRPPLAARPRVWDHVRRWVQRQAALATLGLVALLGGLVFFVIHTVQLGEERDAARAAQRDARASLAASVRAQGDAALALGDVRAARIHFRASAVEERALDRPDELAMAGLLACDVESSPPLLELPRVFERVVQHVATRDGRRAVLWDGDAALALVDLVTGATLRTFRTGGTPIDRIALDPDERVLLASDRSAQLQRWSLDGSVLGALPLPERVTRLHFAAEGRLLFATGGKGRVHVLDAANARVVRTLTISGQDVHEILPDPAGTQVIVAGSHNELSAWRAEDGDVLWRTRHNRGNGPTLSLLPEGEAFVNVSGSGELLFVAMGDGRLLGRIDYASGARTPHALSPDGKLVAVGPRDGLLRILDLEHRRVIDRRHLHDGAIGSISIVASGTRLVSSDLAGRVAVWDLTRPSASLRVPAHAGGAAALVGDGRLWVTGGADGRIRVFDGPSATPLAAWQALSEPVRGLGASTALSRLACVGASGRVRAFTLPEGELLAELAASGPASRAVAVAPDGSSAAVGSVTGQVSAWSLDDGKPLFSVPGRKRQVFGIGYTPDGSHLATSDIDSYVVLRDARTGAHVERLLTDPIGATVYRVRFAADGGHGWISDWEGQVKRIPTRDLSGLGSGDAQLVGRVPEVLMDLAVSPDERRLVTGEASGSLRLWSAAPPGPMRPLLEGAGFCNMLWWSRSGLLGSVHGEDGGDGALRVLDMEAPARYERFHRHLPGLLERLADASLATSAYRELAAWYARRGAWAEAAELTLEARSRAPEAAGEDEIRALWLGGRRAAARSLLERGLASGAVDPVWGALVRRSLR